MILNKNQKYALLLWMGHRIGAISTDSVIVTGYDEFCNEEIREWRVVYNWGFAGKIWNVDDEIYVTGASPHELDKKAYKEQQKIIERWNAEIRTLLIHFS